MAANRKGKLYHQFKQIIEGKEQILSAVKAKLFFEAIQSQNDPSICISQLISSPKGFTALQHALRIDTTSIFINDTAAGFLTYIQDQGLSVVANGSYLRKLISALVDPPIFWNALTWAMESAKLKTEAQHAFAWILLELVSGPLPDAVPHIALANRPSIQKALLDAVDPLTRNIAQKINRVLATIDTPAAEGEQTPGGRHDNDFEEFRNIAILPTIDEIASQDAPFLRFLADVEAQPDSSRFAVHLDNQFRLLRDDMLRDLREEVKAILTQSNSKRRGVMINKLRLAGIACDTKSGWTILLQCERDLAGLPAKPLTDRVKFLEQNRKWLPHDSLAALLVDGKVAGFGTISRNVSNMAQNPPVLHLRLPNEGHILKRTLTTIRGKTDISMIQLRTAVFAYEPVLKQLQNIRLLPLAEQIMGWKTGADVLQHNHKSPELDDLIVQLQSNHRQDLQQLLRLPKPTKLDINQAQSLVAGVTQTLAIIQGPPGTGKSFIGALIAKSIYTLTRCNILVLSYTNHALDQCLEDLISTGIPGDDIVRLGSKAKAKDTIKNLVLSGQQSDTYKLRKPDYDVINNARSEAIQVGDKLRDAFNSYNAASATKEELMQYLEFSSEFDLFHEDFQVVQQVDGFRIVSAKGKAINEYYLLDRWASGCDRGVFQAHAKESVSGAWDMTSEARQALLQKWKDSILAERLAKVIDYSAQFGQAASDISDVYSKRDRGVMKDKRIIGCTTTAAAKYVKEIQSTSPDVIIVEEAGEILESHILTAIGLDTQQLILIGDHKQLRPKAHYDLSVEKGTGYDLNRSLFERLVLKKYPHQTLIEQHRMRPEISAFVRKLTYAELRDAPSTMNRPPLKGFQSSVIFANHAVQENDLADAYDPREPGSKGSKTNQFEAEMTLKAVRYLAQQGYRSDQIVVLTPYLGQLRLLFDLLSAENDPVLNDIDSYDLIRAGLMPQSGPDAPDNRLRISTIDNYQGEESDVVVASLARSNPRGDIGFLSAPERLNVLLSRARDGLIILGSASTFMGARKGSELWSEFFSMLKKGSHFYEGIPVSCQKHPHRQHTLVKPTDFEAICPDGGCDQPCQSILRCGIHSCPQKCHQLVDHSKMLCKHIMTEVCPSGHTMSWKCHAKKPLVCSVCEKIRQAEEDKRLRALKHAEQLQQVQQEQDDRMKELESHIQEQQSQIQAARLREQHRVTYEQRVIDLENIKELATEVCPTIPGNGDSKAPVGPTLASVLNTTQEAKYGPTVQATNSLNLSKSSIEREWESIKASENVSSSALDEMMEMTGLDDVKQQFIDIFHKLSTQKRQGTDLSKERLGVVFLGNPGTGKTTVARHYAKFLWQLKAIPGQSFVETTGAKLANGGVASAQKLIDDSLAKGGGTIFVDEAYQLVSKSQYGGGAVLDLLLTEIENQVGQLVFIFAGYKQEMEKFFEHNPGLDSRLPSRFHFVDYNEAQLLHMLKCKIQTKFGGRMKLEEGYDGIYPRIVVKRLHRRSGREGFGNAREIENLLSKIHTVQTRRIAAERAAGVKPDDFLLTKEDMIGPEPSNVLSTNASWQKLSNMMGLNSVKDAIQVLFNRLQQNYQLELQEAPIVVVNLNRLFLGPPGTGKTTVAKLYGQILADLGLLSSSELVLKTPADFISSVVGGSEQNTKSILEAARGKVLVIDEAYMFGASSTKDAPSASADPFRAAVIDTIVSEVQSTPGEDRAVLMLGYKAQMEDMLRNVNPGLARRFPVDSAFIFEDFDDDDLEKILHHKMKERGLESSDTAVNTAINVLAQLRRQPNFGNAGEVQNLLDRAIERWSSRQIYLSREARHSRITLEPVDFDPEYDRSRDAIANCKQMFEGVIGREAVVEKLCGYIDTSINAQHMDLMPEDLLPFNFVFKGPPGTGKTTTARKIGRVFCDMGFLKSDNVVECSATDLIGSYVGQTGPKVLRKLDEALGQVLFVDEAYRLREGHYGKEAIDELVDSLTKPRYKGKLLVVLAGYDTEINDLLRVNPGLSSRFSEEINFHNLTPEDCVAMVSTRLEKSRLTLEVSSTGQDDIKQAFANVMQLPGWGNGRDVETIVKRALAKAIQQRLNMITAKQISEQIANLHEERVARSVHSDTAVSKPNELYQAQPMPHQLPVRITKSAVSTQVDNRQDIANQINPPENAMLPVKPQQDVQRDVGISDEVWMQLQADKVAFETQQSTSEKMIMQLQQAHQESADQVQKATADLETAQRAFTEDDARRLEEEKQRIALVAAKRAADEQAVRLRRAEEEAAGRRKQEAQAQQKLREMDVCVAGYQWIKQSHGYRCAGGTHFVDNEALGI